MEHSGGGIEPREAEPLLHQSDLSFLCSLQVQMQQLDDPNPATEEGRGVARDPCQVTGCLCVVGRQGRGLCFPVEHPQEPGSPCTLSMGLLGLLQVPGFLQSFQGCGVALWWGPAGAGGEP